MICAGFLYLGEIMEERSGKREYLDLLRTELLKQREIYLALKEGHGESVCYKPYQDEGINQDIAENIRNENEQFSVIREMAEGNASDTAEISTQANTINDMVNKMTLLLKKDE